MKVIKTSISDLVILEPKVFDDERGYFMESYQKNRYKQLVTEDTFVQDNFSKSTKGVLRGLHFQKFKPQGKLVSVIEGEVLDVAVDLRLESKTFGLHETFKLTAAKHNQLFVPPGFAHGFVVLSDYAIFHYKCTDFYDPDDEGGILWNDPELDIDWRVNNPMVSSKDKVLPTFKDVKQELFNK
jgi:dTDP-4-dehydrorhamnose 3,5-epimerase